MIRRSTLIAVEILLGLVAALAIGVGVAWWRLSQGPIELGFLREQMQTELSAARGGRPVGLERVELAWTQRGALELRAVNVSVEDGRGGVLSRAEEARIELAVLPLAVGRIQLVRAEFVGGEMTFTRKLDGALHIAFGPEGAPPDIIVPASPTDETLEQKVARWLDGMESAFRPVGPGGDLRGLSVRGARLAVIDEEGGGRWTAQGANLELSRERDALALSADARLEGAEGLAPASLRITTDTQFRSAVIEFGATDVRPRALFSAAALGPFAGLDAPFTATVSIGLDRETGVNRFEGDAVLGRGTADAGGQQFSLDGGRFHGRYDIASDELIIDQLQLAGATTRIGGEIRVRDVSSIFRAEANQAAAFTVALPSLTVDVPGTLSQPAAFTNVEIVGAIASAERSVRFSRIHAETGQGVLDASGRLYWAEAGADRRLRPGIEVNGQLQGSVDARAVVAMWPMGLGEGARDYLARSLTGGRISDASVRIDVRPADIAAGVLRDEAMDIRFNVADASMQFVTTMSPVTNARGSAVLRGNRFDMTIPEARFHNMIVSNGRVELPRLKPKGAMATISARIDGDARSLLEVLGQEPIALGERLPVAAASATGRGTVNIRIQRPMLREAPFETWRFNLDGAIRDFAGAMTTRRIALSHGQLQVRGDQRAITVSGPIRAGTSAINEVRWVEHIGRRGRASSEYRISGDFDADDLERLGYPVARYAQGRIGVTISGQGRGFDVDNAQIELDLTRAAVEAPRQFWTKRAGQAASAQFTVERQRDGGLAFANIDARGAGLNTQGRMRLSRDNRIMEVELTRLAIEGRADARINATRARDGGLDVTVRGALFDAAPFMGGGEDAPGEARATNAGAAAPLRASVIVDRLKMRGGATLSDARVEVTTSRGALAMLTAEGRAPSGRAFSLGLGPRPGNPQGRIRLRSDDAGFAVAALTGAENIVGGTAAADGDWRTGPPSQARFDVRLRDFQVVRLPAMARLLSSAGSLTGLVETLNGEGISFTALDAEMAYANDRLTITEGRMAGPSMGLTGSGAYNIARDDLDIDGVVAPSPLLNLSMLGEVPVIGDLLVSRRGEGVFGMTYTINGPAGQPRVGVNPVSALTPGILRRIFEPVRENNVQSLPPLAQDDTPAPAAPQPAAEPLSATPRDTAALAPAN
ncbi:MAG TPA: DUF3971 domain-containing protein [Vitreimonas sp.]|uniref:YhdP family protein n=1 Tax=Vitreimonas sp. TaxID=3069702 RepID=UPI002D50F6AC|nr:DUF3971 domain-containing protein [Vitreimonas sp.]HYD88409.1 DUF3971 domain-containing protein [Vitreimonas sp.]